jgi:hypothetical protein
MKFTWYLLNLYVHIFKDESVEKVGCQSSGVGHLIWSANEDVFLGVE